MNVPCPEFFDIYSQMVNASDGRPIVEVGCWVGNSLWWLVHEIKRQNRHILAVGVEDFSCLDIPGNTVLTTQNPRLGSHTPNPKMSHA